MSRQFAVLKSFFLAFSFGFVLLSGTALAQQFVPPTADAGRVNSDVRMQTAPQGAINVPQDMTTTAEVTAPKGADKVKLVLRRVNVNGATKLANDEVEAAYQGMIGKKISLVDVFAIANKITRIYRDHGYLLSRAIVPQQQIKDGVVKIQVVEGFISGYAIQGKDFGARREIEAFAKKMMSKGTLNAKDLERYLLLMNDLPGMSVRSVLAPSKTVAGGADMILVVQQKKFQGLAAVDNFGNSYLGHERLTLGGQTNSLFGSSDQINGTVLWAPDHDELQYYSAGLRHNVGNEGTKIGVNVSYAKTDPSLPNFLGGLLEPEGESVTVSFNALHPFIRSRDLNVNGGLIFDITSNKTDYAPGLSAIETDDDQRIIRANGQVTYLDSYAGYNAANAVISQGLEVFGSSEKGDSNLSRANGDPGFTKFNLDLSRLQRLYGPFTGLLAMTGQYSADSLLSSEQFGLGGTEFGRGYDSSEITGDHGLAGKVELAYNGQVQRPYLDNYQVYTFYDLGAVWTRSPLIGQDSKESLASAGVGTRLTFNPYVRGDAFIAKPLTHDITSRGDDSKDLRFKFALTSNF